MEILAQQLPGVPAPPPTESTVEWIAVALVIVLILVILAGGPLLLRANREDRRAQLSEFRDELRLQREAAAAAQERHTREVEVTHQRIDRLRDQQEELVDELRRRELVP